jgi:hypothetical protein
MAVISTYPINGQPIVRGDPLTIQVDISRSVDGVKTPIDITDWAWWAHVRRSADAALVTEFVIEAVTPPDGTFPSRLLLNLTPDQTRLLKSGMVFDLEQITDHTTPTSIRTWWSCSKLTVLKDVSHDA